MQNIPTVNGTRANGEVDAFVDEVERVPQISWNAEKVGVIHSSFFWGYIITQIPSGYVASIYPPYK